MNTIKMFIVNSLWAWIECHSVIKNDTIIVFDERTAHKVVEKLYSINNIMRGDAPSWRIEIANIRSITVE